MCEIKNDNPSLEVFYYPSYEEIIKNIQRSLNNGDLLLTIGAGKVNKVGEELIKL